jgi:signal transduction histidine kinase
MRVILKKLAKGCKVQESSANLMEFLVQDLLDFAQIRAGKFRKNIKQFNIKEAIDQVIDIQSYKAGKQGIELKVKYLNINDKSVDSYLSFSPLINSDMARIQQVILNLQSNALKFTEKGSVTIECSI